jgi:hypothetical protein
MTFVKKPKTAVPAIFAIAIIVLGIAGFSYAHWSETLSLNGSVTTGKLCIRFYNIDHKDKGVDWTCGPKFMSPDPMQRPDGKNIGTTTLTLEQGDCPQLLTVVMNNTYPSYYEGIEFHPYNCGTIPLSLMNVTITTDYGTYVLTNSGYKQLNLTADGKPDVEIYWGNSFHMQIDPNDWIEVSFQIHVLQDAPQNTTMHFTITMLFINWNEDPLCHS